MSAGGPTLRTSPRACSVRHVAGRADDLTRQGLPLLDLQPLGDPEVNNLGNAAGVEQDVGWLQVAMHDARLMRCVHGAGESLHQFGRCANGLGRPFEPIGQASPFEQLERDERATFDLAEVIDLDDVGVAKAGDGLGLDHEPLVSGGAGVLAVTDHLQCDNAVQGTVPGLVNDTHPAAAQLGEQLEFGDAGQVDTAEPGARAIPIE